MLLGSWSKRAKPVAFARDGTAGGSPASEIRFDARERVRGSRPGQAGVRSTAEAWAAALPRTLIVMIDLPELGAVTGRLARERPPGNGISPDTATDVPAESGPAA